MSTRLLVVFLFQVLIVADVATAAAVDVGTAVGTAVGTLVAVGEGIGVAVSDSVTCCSSGSTSSIAPMAYTLKWSNIATSRPAGAGSAS